MTLILLLLFLPGTGIAGAWPREKNELFIALSTSFGHSQSGQNYQSQELYTEYGLTRRLTVVLDGYQSSGSDDGRLALSLRQAVGKTDAVHHFAITSGMGKDLKYDGYFYRLGGSWGMDLTGGWVNLDAQSDVSTDAWWSDYKAEFTFGVHLQNRDMSLIRLTHEQNFDTGHATWISPGYIWRASDHILVEFGIAKGIRQGTDSRLKIGSWLVF